MAVVASSQLDPVFESHPFMDDEDNEILARYKVGDWSVYHLAAYQDWAEEAVFGLDINLLNSKSL